MRKQERQNLNRMRAILKHQRRNPLSEIDVSMFMENYEECLESPNDTVVVRAECMRYKLNTARS